jgi:hypothetical protein
MNSLFRPNKERNLGSMATEKKLIADSYSEPAWVPASSIARVRRSALRLSPHVIA